MVVAERTVQGARKPWRWPRAFIVVEHPSERAPDFRFVGRSRGVPLPHFAIEAAPSHGPASHADDVASVEPFPTAQRLQGPNCAARDGRPRLEGFEQFEGPRKRHRVDIIHADGVTGDGTTVKAQHHQNAMITDGRQNDHVKKISSENV